MINTLQTTITALSTFPDRPNYTSARAYATAVATWLRENKELSIALTTLIPELNTVIQQINSTTQNIEDIETNIEEIADVVLDLKNEALGFKNLAEKYAEENEDAYKTVLGRASDVEGKNYWLEQLNSGRVTEQDLYKAIANAAVEFDIKGYLARTGDYSLKTVTMLSDSIKNAQKYLADNISQTTTTQTTNYYTQNSSDKALEQVVKELQRLNIISATNAEATKSLLKTNKQALITGLQG